MQSEWSSTNSYGSTGEGLSSRSSGLNTVSSGGSFGSKLFSTDNGHLEFYVDNRSPQWRAGAGIMGGSHNYRQLYFACVLELWVCVSMFGNIWDFWVSKRLPSCRYCFDLQKPYVLLLNGVCDNL